LRFYINTPIEVLNGKTFNKIETAQQMQTAKALRIAENKQEKCCSYSF